MASHSWSAVKLDLYGLKFYYEHVLRQPEMIRLPPPWRSSAHAHKATPAHTLPVLWRADGGS